MASEVSVSSEYVVGTPMTPPEERICFAVRFPTTFEALEALLDEDSPEYHDAVQEATETLWDNWQGEPKPIEFEIDRQIVNYFYL